MCQSSASLRTWSKTPGKLWKVGETADGGARENSVFPPFLRLAAASIRRCCTCVPGVFDQMPAAVGGPFRRAAPVHGTGVQLIVSAPFGSFWSHRADSPVRPARGRAPGAEVDG